jgi:hypothetical protein
MSAHLGKFSFIMNLIEANAVLGLKIGPTVQVIFASPEAQTLLGANSDSEVQEIDETTNKFSSLKKKNLTNR